MVGKARALPFATILYFILIELAHGQSWTPVSFNPMPNQISPFGYGSVQQFLAGQSGKTGDEICTAHNSQLKCFSVSGSNSCGSELPQGQLVSCGLSANPNVNQTDFLPVNCNGNSFGDGGRSGLLTNADFCLVTGYMPSRQQNTLYQFDDFVRLGINTLYGGTVFELYGVDGLDRIVQNAGAGVQLSLWAYNPQYANKQYAEGFFVVPPYQSKSCNTTLYETAAACTAANPGQQCAQGVAGPNLTSCPTVYPCGGNGATAGSPINPIQAVSIDCNYGLQSGVVDSIYSNAPGQITVKKSSPANFTQSGTYPLTWTQTTQVTGPYAMITYSISVPAGPSDIDFQEIPAIFTHGGLGTNIYFYDGANPYADVGGAVSFVNGMTAPQPAVVQLPGRAGPFGTGAVGKLSEDWMSSCDTTGKKCLTVATFSALTQDFVASYSSYTSYLGIHGFFSLTNGQTYTITTFLFPYRFDDVIMGRSVRQWIYELHQNPLYSK
jgi:hypothetical protein